MSAQDFQKMVDSIPGEDFEMALRMQLESVNFEDLPEELQAAFVERADRLGVEIVGRPDR